MPNNTDNFLHSYHWISATRIGAAPQQTHVMLRHDVSDASIYKEYQLVERIKMRGWDKARLSFPERFIEEVEVLRSSLATASTGTFQMTPPERYGMERTIFKYQEGLHRSYDILYDQHTGQWIHLHEQKPVFTWNQNAAQWQSLTTATPVILPWHQQRYEASTKSNIVRWSADSPEYAVILRSDELYPQGAIRFGDALAYNKAGQSYPVRVVDAMIGTIEPIAGEANSPQDVMGLGLWANTRSYLAFLDGLTAEQAQGMTRLVQMPVA